MTKDQLTSRILSAEANIDSQAFRTGNLTDTDWADLAHASEMLHNAPIFMDDTSGITIPEVKAKVRRLNQDPDVYKRQSWGCPPPTSSSGRPARISW